MIGHFKNYQIDITLSVAEDILFWVFQVVFFGVRNVACRSNKVATFLLQVIDRIFNSKMRYFMISWIISSR